jgi:hypothetical protein
MGGFQPVLSFDRDGADDHPFVMGVEVGRLWEQLKDPDGFEQTIHTENVEMVMRMQEATGRQMRIEDSADEDWCFLYVEPEPAYLA